MRNKEDRSFIILKLGGSLMTDKSKPFSLRKKVLRRVISEIIQTKKNVIIIHGGGSFAHPIAKKYNINSGRDRKIQNQIFGLTKTHNVMTELNKYVVDEFMKREIPALSIQSSTIFLMDLTKGLKINSEIIKLNLELGIIPILYGDVIFHSDGNFSIISGDTIILKLCECLQSYNISKVIFLMETNGLYINDEKSEIKLALNIKYGDIESIPLANLGGKIDITGGIKIKLQNIKEILKLGIPVQLVNGLKENFVKEALFDKKIESTCFFPPHEKDS